jgi:hypothetical protein
MSSSPVRIVATGAADRREWEKACRESAASTFFHTPYFADIFIRAGRGRTRAAATKVEFSDGVSAIVPLVCRKNLGGLITTFFSMPALCFGGWIPQDKITASHARALTAWFHSMNDFVWRENPYDPMLRDIDLAHTGDDFTQTIDLAGGFCEASKRFDHAHRKAVKKALAAGVSVAEASNPGQWESYFSLYQQSRDRWKSRGLERNRGFDAAVIDAIRECPHQCRKLWLAQVQGKTAAGIVCFYWNRHAVAWLGAGDAGYFHCRPNNLLYEQAIRHAADAQYSWFDCNPSGGLAGVVEFKTHLGAIKMRSRIVNKRSRFRSVAERLRSMVR